MFGSGFAHVSSCGFVSHAVKYIFHAVFTRDEAGADVGAFVADCALPSLDYAYAYDFFSSSHLSTY